MTQLLCICAALLALGVVPAWAQTPPGGAPNPLGINEKSDQPVQIEAATLEVRDKNKAATFSGNVQVVQGEPFIQHVVQVDVREQRRDHAALGRAARHARENALVERPRLQPFVDHLSDDAVRHSLVEESSEFRVVDGVERRHHRLPIPKTFRLQWSSPAGGIPSRDAASP